MPIPPEQVVAYLTAVGCAVDGDDPLRVVPPTWRPDLLLPADLVEEVVRLADFERLPSVLPRAAAGRGLSGRQRLRRDVGRALAAAGHVEVLSYPFVASSVHDAFGLAADDPRRAAPRLVNPISEDEPELRTSLLPGLLATLQRNVGRGSRDLAIFESGLVFLRHEAQHEPELPGIAGRPSDEQIAAIDTALPSQPTHVAAAFCGNVEAPGWWGPGRAASWTDAVAAAQVVAHVARVELSGAGEQPRAVAPRPLRRAGARRHRQRHRHRDRARR